jgi:non-ribosomal peptide synthetase component F
LVVEELADRLIKEHSKVFWRNELHSPLPGFPLYADFPQSQEARDVQKTTFPLDIDPAQAESLGGTDEREAWMLACYFVLMHRLTNDKDLLVGLKSSRGNVLPLRAVCRDHDTFSQLYAQIRTKRERAFAHDIPYADIERLSGQKLTFQTIYGEDSRSEDSCPNWHVQEADAHWTLQISYRRNRIQEQPVERFAGYFKHIVAAALRQPEMPIGHIHLLTPAGRKTCFAPNDSDKELPAATTVTDDTDKEMPASTTVTEMFAAVVQRFSGRIALSASGHQITYGQLDLLSNRVASMLLAKGMSKGQFVSVYMERTMETVVSLLGILKAGGVCVHLDPGQPEERNAYIMADAKPDFVLTKTGYAAGLEALLGVRYREKQILFFDENLFVYAKAAPAVSVEAHDAAYKIYPSGSSGNPKGALISHKGAVNLCMGIKSLLDLNEEDILLQNAAFSFGASVFDLLGFMANGSGLKLLSDEKSS